MGQTICSPCQAASLHPCSLELPKMCLGGWAGLLSSWHDAFVLDKYFSLPLIFLLVMCVAYPCVLLFT